jgi:hypothetical protein
MVARTIAGNISAEATTPAGNTFAEAMRGLVSIPHRLQRSKLDSQPFFHGNASERAPECDDVP